MALRRPDPNSPETRGGRAFEEIIANLFRQHGWKVKAGPRFGGEHADLLVMREGRRYAVEFKAASEGRSDRLVPLLAQEILEARAFAQVSPKPALPLAMVAAPSISPSVLKKIVRFLEAYAPDAAAGILDGEGLRYFIGPGLETLNEAARRPVRRQRLSSPEPAYLFSDLNQWMLKVLLAPLIPESLLQAPRGEYRNASDLSAAANVSVMSAFRLVRQLRQEGFLDDRDGSLRIVRRGELLNRWRAAYLRGAPEMPLRWIIPGRKENRLSAALRAYGVQLKEKRQIGPRACLGLFTAAESLGFGFVGGAPQYFYLERLDGDVLRRMGLSSEGAEQRADVYVRVPHYRESVFRAAVLRDGVPASDILQVWLDVGFHPSRGEEQAAEVRRRALAAVFEEDR